MPIQDRWPNGDPRVIPTASEAALVNGMNFAAFGGPGNIAALHFDGPVLNDLLIAAQEIDRLKGPR